jgi:hypothetical protein
VAPVKLSTLLSSTACHSLRVGTLKPSGQGSFAVTLTGVFSSTFQEPFVAAVKDQPEIAASFAALAVGAAAKPLDPSLAAPPTSLGPLYPLCMYAPCKPATGMSGSSEVSAPKL